MSLPRDLKVQIPGHGTDKINAAYEQGGPRLTLKTVKQLTGLRINHVINIDFRSFYAGRQRPGLHLHRRGPALLQQQRPVRLHQRARRLPAPVRPRGAPVRALPLRGQRPRALRPPAGLPAPGQAAGGRRPPDRGPLEAREDLRQVHLVGHPRPGRGAADRQARRRLDRPAGARGPLRGPDRRELRDRQLAQRAQAGRAVPRRRGDARARAASSSRRARARSARRAAAATTSRTSRSRAATRACRRCSRASARASRSSTRPSA